MVNLFVFNKSYYWNIRFEERKDWKNFQFKVVNNELEICNKNQKYRIQNGNTLQIDNFCFLLDTSLCSFHRYKKKRIMSFGRDANNSYSFNHPFISSYHLKIVDNQIIDLNSTNGTYLNGNRITTSTLSLMDQIAFANVILYVLDDYLLMNQKFDDELPEIISNDSLIHLQEHHSVISMEQTIETIEIETPIFQDDPKKGKWFEAIGSSFLLLISSCISVVIRYLLNPSDTSQLETMFLTSGSMCFAFFVYGLWNRNNTWKESWAQKQKMDALYIDYLNEQRDRMELKKNEFRSRDKEYERKCIQLNHSMYGVKHSLWLCKREQSIMNVYSRTIPYQYSKYDLSYELNKVIQEGNQIEYTNCFIEEYQRIWIQSEHIQSIFYLYLQSLWSKEDVLWVWMTKTKLNHIFENENSRIGHLFLWIKEEKDILEIQSLMKNKEFYLVSDNDLCVRYQFSCKKLIYVSLNPIPVSFDFMISDFPILNDAMDKLRLVLYQSNWDNPFTFQDILKVDSIYNYSLNWSQQLCLKIPIGLDESGNPIVLDFHDSKDGPHGLVAGTTGSGKSEWMTSVLLQLSLYNDPNLVQYILIDFKGGAFGDVFYQFPHCAGMITNLDENTMDRFMMSLNAEIKERQELFRCSNCSVAHIDAYNQISKQPMSHLFIVIDEFAQLKMKYSESMSYLKELARIGRSLGIHLILSTQKPMGIIDEQIWSNSRWKVCLKVNDKNDSREVLHNDSASHLKQAGEFILQIGNQEIESKGTGFWMQEIADRNNTLTWQEVDENNKILHQNKFKEETILKVLSKKILEMNRNHNWIILPDIVDFKDWNKNGFLVDRPYRKEQVFLNLIHKNSIVLYKNEESISTFMKTCISIYSKEPLYTFGFKNYDTYMDDSFMNEYWNVDEGIVFVRMKPDMNFIWLKSLITNSKITCILLTNDCDSKVKNIMALFEIQLCISYGSLDIARYFLDFYSIPKIKKNQMLMRMENHLDLVQIREIEPKKLKRKKKKLVAPDFLFRVGISSDGGVVYWNKNRKLMICFVQQSYLSYIDSLCLKWIRRDKQLTIGNGLENDICIINCLYESSIFQTKEYLENRFDLDVLWLGLGLEDYVYFMKKKVPLDLNEIGVYMTKGKYFVLEELDD